VPIVLQGHADRVFPLHSEETELQVSKANVAQQARIKLGASGDQSKVTCMRPFYLLILAPLPAEELKELSLFRLLETNLFVPFLENTSLYAALGKEYIKKSTKVSLGSFKSLKRLP
jgi:hypothetical protein